MFKITNLTRFTNFDEIEQLLQWLANRLEITTGEVVLVSDSKLLKRFSTNDVELHALLTQIAPNDIYKLILEDKPSNLNIILCHEMVHLSQYIRRDLKLDLNKKEFTWKGVKYNASVPYDERPWEIEAFSKQDKLYKEYKKAINTNKKCIFNFLKKK